LQPRQFYLRIQKSMKEEFNPLIKSCSTRTVPSTGINNLDKFHILGQLRAVYQFLQKTLKDMDMQQLNYTIWL
jgi:hypothetical protein